jgi:hypothetical protein
LRRRRLRACCGGKLPPGCNVSNVLKSKLFWAAVVPLALVGLYALLGFKVAPSIARDQAQAFVREHYQRELAVGEISLQPFKLQVEVRDLALPDRDGRPMLGFARLVVDFEIASLWNRAFTFSEVTVEAPLVRAVVRQDGSLNLADLALPEEQPEEPTPSVWIHQLAVERGTIDFVDEARATPFARSFHAVGFALEDFRTTPEGGDFRFRARSADDETFDWKGRFALEPVISSQGEFRVGALHARGVAEFLGDALPFALSQGTIDLAGSYHMALDEQIELGVELPSIELKDLSLRARGVDTAWVRIPSLVVSGTHAALPAQTVTIEKVALEALEVQAWMSPDGSVNLEQLFAAAPTASATPAVPPKEAHAAATAAAGKADEGATQEHPWTVTVGSIELANASIAFEDRAMTPATRFDLAPVNVRVSNVSLDLSRPVPVQIDAMINGHARFDGKGTLTPEPLAADLDIKLAKARMQILQPYVLPVADLTITGGELNVDGRVKLAPPEQDGPDLAFAGNVFIDRFQSVDNALEQDLVNFGRLDLQKLQYAMAPDSLSIDRVLVRQPYARVIISEERVINIAAVLDPQGTAAALAERRAAAAAEAARSPAERRRLEKEREAAAKADKAGAKARKAGMAPPPPREPAPPDTFPIRIREVRVEGGRMDFSDYFIEPNFSAEVQDLNGTITGMSSAFDSRAQVKLAGQLGEFSPVSIAGELQPFAFDRYTDLRLRFENISLPIFNPYSGPLAGYNIAKGKLTTDLHYNIVDRKLDARHEIRVDQLEWGEATATQGEATLPVKFATSLLKDRHGVINLDVPVGGTLDDPSFRIGPIIWQVIKNIIVKAVSAPFSLLGSLFAGAEEAQFIDFAPGEAALDAATTERLGALAKSLVEKPELKLDVPIGALPEVDLPALSERAYRTAVDGAVARHFAKMAKKGQPIPQYGSLEPRHRIEVLTALVKQQSGTEPKVPEAPEPPQGTPRAEAKALREAAAIEYLEMTARAGVVVPDTELAKLAEERAVAIERALLTDSGLEPTRVFKVREGKVSLNEGKVRFQLGLK